MKTDYKCPECGASLVSFDELPGGGMMPDCIPCGLSFKIVDGQLEPATLEDINAYYAERNRQELFEANQ